LAINKNFVVKNGLEVNTDLILADADTNRVGIGSTIPTEKLDVGGTIAAENAIISGFSTVSEALNVGDGGTIFTAYYDGKPLVGVGTYSPQYNLDVYGPVSTGQTALGVYGDVYLSGQINQVSVSGTSFFNGAVYLNSDITINGNYYGEASTLSGIVTTIVAGTGITISPSNGKGLVEVEVLPFDFVSNLGVKSDTTYIGAGVTTLAFEGVTVSSVVGGVSTVTVTPGATIGLVLALGS